MTYDDWTAWYRPRYWILDGHTAVPTDDVLEWGRMFRDTEGRTVARTRLPLLRVSTVFLGMDHALFEGPPLLFETMIFGGDNTINELQAACTTWAQAELMHEEALRAARRYVRKQSAIISFFVMAVALLFFVGTL